MSGGPGGFPRGSVRTASNIVVRGTHVAKLVPTQVAAVARWRPAREPDTANQSGGSPWREIDWRALRARCVRRLLHRGGDFAAGGEVVSAADCGDHESDDAEGDSRHDAGPFGLVQRNLR